MEFLLYGKSPFGIPLALTGREARRSRAPEEATMLKTIRALLTIVILFSVIPSFAAQSQIHDTSRRLYDRIMEEFKHRDYEAALAGFRLFIEIHGQDQL